VFPVGLAKRTVADHLRHFLSKVRKKSLGLDSGLTVADEPAQFVSTASERRHTVASRFHLGRTATAISSRELAIAMRE
jgi:hypothetical protein